MSYREVKKVPFFFFVSFLFASFAEKVSLGRDRHLCILLPLHLLCWVGPSPVHTARLYSVSNESRTRNSSSAYESEKENDRRKYARSVEETLEIQMRGVCEAVRIDCWREMMGNGESGAKRGGEIALAKDVDGLTDRALMRCASCPIALYRCSFPFLYPTNYSLLLLPSRISPCLCLFPPHIHTHTHTLLFRPLSSFTTPLYFS